MQADDLTNEQKMAYAENEAALTNLETQVRSFQETAHSRLAAVGLHFEPDATYCFLCPCEEFIGADHQCDRVTCHHARHRHNSFI